jgi:hypothetical protein
MERDDVGEYWVRLFRRVDEDSVFVGSGCAREFCEETGIDDMKVSSKVRYVHLDNSKILD